MCPFRVLTVAPHPPLMYYLPHPNIREPHKDNLMTQRITHSYRRTLYCADLAQATQEPLIGTALSHRLHLVIALHRNHWGQKLEALGPADENNQPFPLSDNALITDIIQRSGEFARLVKAEYDTQVMFTARHARSRTGDDLAPGTLWLFPHKFRFAPDSIQTRADLRTLIEAALNAPAELDPDAVEPGDDFLLMCTHNARDAACGDFSAAFSKAFNAIKPDNVHLWEISHIGGHRFAATLAHQPAMRWYGGLTPADAQPLLDALSHGQVYTPRHRGRPDYPPPMQVAENWAWNWVNAQRGQAEVVSIDLDTITHDPATHHGQAIVSVTFELMGDSQRLQLTLRGEPYEFIPNTIKRGDYLFDSQADADAALPTKTRTLWSITRIAPLG